MSDQATEGRTGVLFDGMGLPPASPDDGVVALRLGVQRRFSSAALEDHALGASGSETRDSKANQSEKTL